MGRLRALNRTIACENITGEHIDPFEGVVVSHAAQEPFIHLTLVKLRRRRFFLFFLSRHATALHHEARFLRLLYAAYASTSTDNEQRW